MLDNAFEQLQERTVRLLDESNKSLASLLALVAAATMVFETARRDALGLTSEHVAASDYQDPTTLA
jgi:hypothetical protein